MYDQQAFEQLKSFFETNPVSREAAAPLSSKVEIGVTINEHTQCVFFKDASGAPKFEKRAPVDPDVIFFLTPEAVESLINGPHHSIGELGISITKNYLAGSVKIKVVGSILNLLTRGYLGILKAGGMEYTKFLATHGITNLSKIKSLIQKLRS